MTRDILGLELDAPLMSFGGARVDGQPSAYPVPTRSMIAGLLGNALGYRRTDSARLQALQDGLRLGVAVLRHGRAIRDHVATDLGRPHMRGPMWTTEGRPVAREGSAATDVRLESRPYVADAHILCAVAIVGTEVPAPADLRDAVREPARPLFLGRAGCPATDSLDADLVTAADVDEALDLLAAERAARIRKRHLPADLASGHAHERVEIVMGVKDWHLGVHAGQEVRTVRAESDGDTP